MELLDVHTHSTGNTFGIYNGLPINPDPVQPFSLGLHPWYITEEWEREIIKIEGHLKDPKLYALGECGFDMLKGPSADLQLKVFHKQAALAKQFELPLILHCVKGQHLLQQYLKKIPSPPFIIWHGFNQKISIAQRFLEFPVYFSFGEAIFKENSNAQNWLIDCPKDRIFFETDSSEKNISSIYEQASLILRLSVQTLDRLVKENWRQISKRGIDE